MNVNYLIKASHFLKHACIRKFTILIIIVVPDPIVNINVGHGTDLNRTFISGQGFIFCSAEVLPIDVPRNVSFSWYGPEGQISEGEKYELMDPFKDAVVETNVFISQLVINNLENSDNMTVYYCSVKFGVNDTSFDRALAEYVIPGRTTSESVSLILQGRRMLL